MEKEASKIDRDNKNFICYGNTMFVVTTKEQKPEHLMNITSSRFFKVYLKGNNSAFA